MPGTNLRALFANAEYMETYFRNQDQDQQEGENI